VSTSERTVHLDEVIQSDGSVACAKDVTASLLVTSDFHSSARRIRRGSIPAKEKMPQCFVASQPSSSNEPANPPWCTSRDVNRKDETHEVISQHVGSPALHPQVTINAEHNPATQCNHDSDDQPHISHHGDINFSGKFGSDDALSLADCGGIRRFRIWKTRPKWEKSRLEELSRGRLRGQFKPGFPAIWAISLCDKYATNSKEVDFSVFTQQRLKWLPGLDLNQRPSGYENVLNHTAR